MQEQEMVDELIGSVMLSSHISNVIEDGEMPIEQTKNLSDKQTEFVENVHQVDEVLTTEEITFINTLQNSGKSSHVHFSQPDSNDLMCHDTSSCADEMFLNGSRHIQTTSKCKYKELGWFMFGIAVGAIFALYLPKTNK